MNQVDVAAYLPIETFLGNPYQDDQLEKLMRTNTNATCAQILVENFEKMQCLGCSQLVMLPDYDTQKCLVGFQPDVARGVVCPRCNGLYCLECDIFIHECLLQCPTCPV